MRILILTTADYAAVEPLTNKLNIMGVFRNIAVPSFPATHRRMYLVVKIEGTASRTDEPHRLQVSVIGTSGDEIARIESSFAFSPGSRGIAPEHNALFEFNGLIFRTPGNYLFKVNVNDGEVKESTIVHAVLSES